MSGLFAVLAVAAGGFVGAPARALADRIVTDRSRTVFPLGTFAVNAAGSLLFGLVAGLSLDGHLPALAVDLLATGFCGALTTFSTWCFETVRLVQEGRYGAALANVMASLAVGLAAAAAGLALGLAA